MATVGGASGSEPRGNLVKGMAERKRENILGIRGFLPVIYRTTKTMCFELKRGKVIIKKERIDKG